jgi:chorismate mutase / prephenate dehydratase
MNESGTSLQSLRGEIDRIDSELHALIQQRASLVEEIRRVKARDSVTTVRPGREADILRNLHRHHDSAFSFAAIARIWREIIAGITRMEMPEYAVAVCAGGTDQAIWDLARNQFGSASPMTAFATTREVLTEVAAGRATVGVLPCPREGDSDPWWTNINVRDGLRISYRLPFAPADGRTDGGTEALAIGRIVPEATGSDRSLIVVETQVALSRAGVTGLAERVGIKGHPIASCKAGLHFQLLDAEGYIVEDDPRIGELARLNDVAQVTVIGNYATPIGQAASTGPVS